MKNDIDKKHKVLSSINKYNIHFNNIYKPIKYFLKLIHNDNFVSDNFLFNFKYQSFIMNLFKNYYHDILNKNSSPCNIQDKLINKEIMVNFDNIKNSDSNEYDINLIKNKFNNINDDSKYSIYY